MPILSTFDPNFVPANETPRQKGLRHGALVVWRIKGGMGYTATDGLTPKTYSESELDEYYEGYFDGFAAAREPETRSAAQWAKFWANGAQR